MDPELLELRDPFPVVCVNPRIVFAFDRDSTNERLEEIAGLGYLI